MNTPILLLLFNRPTHTKKLIDRLRSIKPSILYIAIDGPRENNIQDRKDCQTVREIIQNEIDWECRVHKLVRKKNLGCKLGVYKGITWFFRNVEAGIILEDDCVPDPTFFRYCSNLLRRFYYDNRIFTISGDYFHDKYITSKKSYYYSRYPHVWGWATWRRVWKLYDVNISEWGKLRDTNWIYDIGLSPLVAYYWSTIFDQLYNQRIDTWDYQLTFASFKYKGFNIIPTVNLVTNIGFGKDATHTKSPNSRLTISTERMKFPLKHPSTITYNKKSDRAIERKIYLNPIAVISLTLRLIWSTIHR